jgi:hypothetical protein
MDLIESVITESISEILGFIFISVFLWTGKKILGWIQQLIEKRKEHKQALFITIASEREIREYSKSLNTSIKEKQDVINYLENDLLMKIKQYEKANKQRKQQMEIKMKHRENITKYLYILLVVYFFLGLFLQWQYTTEIILIGFLGILLFQLYDLFSLLIFYSNFRREIKEIEIELNRAMLTFGDKITININLLVSDLLEKNPNLTPDDILRSLRSFGLMIERSYIIHAFFCHLVQPKDVQINALDTIIRTNHDLHRKLRWDELSHTDRETFLDLVTQVADSGFVDVQVVPI